MGFDSMIKSNVRKAFNMVKDLASTVTLSQKNGTSFNFATEAVTNSNTVTKTIKGLMVEQKRPHGSTKVNPELGTSLQMSFQFQSADLQDPDVYDTITMANGDVWRMVPPYKDDGYLITVNVAKEA